MPLRCLFGPVAANSLLALAPPAMVGWRTFGGAGAELHLRPDDTWQTIALRLGNGWQPDAVVVLLGQESIPIGLWSAPLPLVALAPDGFRHWHYSRHVLPHCDLVATDAEGAERLRRLGLDRLHVPMRWDDGPSSLDPAASKISRDLDVLFLGSLHPAEDRQRLARLGRIVRLGVRWRVHFAPAGRREEQCELLRRARLYFHRGQEIVSIHRLWTAATAGALPFVPADDAAAGPLWRDRHNCVRYTADNLETLLEHYLENEEERQRLAEAARETACSSATVGLWPELLSVLESERGEIAKHTVGRVPWDRHSELLARAWQTLGAARPADDSLIADLAAAVAAAPTLVALRQALGLATAAQGDHAAAAEHFRGVLGVQPDHALAGLYRAEALVHAGRGHDAIEQARQTLAMLDGQHLDFASLDSPPYPSGRGVFAVEWERVAWQHVGDAEGECRDKSTLLRWRLHGLLARQTGELAYRYEAALARPDLPATRATLGSALRQADRPAEAAYHLRQALTANPFDAATAHLLYETLGLLGRPAEQQRLIQERRLLHHSAPHATAAENWFLPAPTQSLTVSRPRVSLCMIVKDEEGNLPICLASVADLVQEIIIVDTGSRDATKDVARRYGAKIYDFTWCNSFAAARNESLRYATGDWIFWPDADDTLDADNRRKLRTLIARLGFDLAAYLMRQHSWPDPVTGSALVIDQAKLFRHDPRLRFEYRVHEQIVPAVLRLGGVMRTTDIVFHHSGYQDPQLRRSKMERNRRLLLLDQADRPDDPLTLYNLATLYLDLGQAEEAVEFLRRSLERAPAGYSLIPRLHGLLTLALHRLGRKAEALAACRQGRTAYPGEADLLFWEARLLSEMGDESEAEAHWRRLLSMPAGPALGCLDTSIHGYRSRHQLALLCRRQGRAEEAEQLWREAVRERPDFVPAWLALVELHLNAEREAELAMDLIHLESDASTREAANVVRARLLLARHEFTAARALLEEAVRSLTPGLWVRLLLGQMLAQEGRDSAAAVRVLREVLALDPHQPEARRLLASLQE